MPLCPDCSSLSLLNLSLDPWHVLHPNWASLEISALKDPGCDLCGLIYNLLRDELCKSLHRFAVDESLLSAYRHPGSSTLKSLPPLWDSGGLDTSVRVYAVTTPRKPGISEDWYLVKDPNLANFGPEEYDKPELVGRAHAANFAVKKRARQTPDKENETIIPGPNNRPQINPDTGEVKFFHSDSAGGGATSLLKFKGSHKDRHSLLWAHVGAFDVSGADSWVNSVGETFERPIRQGWSKNKRGMKKGNDLFYSFSTGIEIPVYCDDGDNLAHVFRERRPLARSTADESIWQKAKIWLDECGARHPECQPNKSPAIRLPKRLLDLSGFRASRNLELVDISDKEFIADYVTLTYCWGPSHKEWLHRVFNIQTQNPRRPFHSDLLPQTLLDAVKVCQILDIQYVWVDSLCIIQHDPQDWAVEADKMSDIYERSFLTISASDSSHCNMGFMFDRSQAQVEGLVLDLDLSKHAADTALATTVDSRIVAPNGKGQKDGKLHVLNPSLLGSCIITGGPVATRAWCLQERRLSNRILHCCASQIFYECTRCQRFESEIGTDPCFMYPHDDWRNECGKPLGRVQSYFEWYRIVDDYSIRQLSHGSDKLVAISGLARKAHELFGSEYLAGLWRENFGMGLMWAIRDGVPAKRADKWRAPSWSWASMDSPVLHQLDSRLTEECHPFQISTVDLLEHDIKVEPLQPFGQVMSGGVRLRGKMREVSMNQLLQNEPMGHGDFILKSVDHVGWFVEDERKTLQGTQLVLNIGSEVEYVGPSMPTASYILVLERVEGGECVAGRKNRYRRRGWGEIYAWGFFENVNENDIWLI